MTHPIRNLVHKYSLSLIYYIHINRKNQVH